MNNDITADEARELWGLLDNAPEWCARHAVGSLLRGKISGTLFESVAAPRLQDNVFYILVKTVGRDTDRVMDLRAVEIEPVDGLTALSEQAE